MTAGRSGRSAVAMTAAAMLLLEWRLALFSFLVLPLFGMFLTAGLIYLIIAFVLMQGFKLLERWLRAIPQLDALDHLAQRTFEEVAHQPVPARRQVHRHAADAEEGRRLGESIAAQGCGRPEGRRG